MWRAVLQQMHETHVGSAPLTTLSKAFGNGTTAGAASCSLMESTCQPGGCDAIDNNEYVDWGRIYPGHGAAGARLCCAVMSCAMLRSALSHRVLTSHVHMA